MQPGFWNHTDVTRRRFLRTAVPVFLAAPLLSSCSVIPLRSRAARSDPRLRHACIGLGGIGAADVAFFSSHPRVRLGALCDVDSDSLSGTAPLAPEANLYADYRQMLSLEGDRLDSVSVAVPAHMHFAICAAALKAGKNVCCHGPFGHNIEEIRVLRRLAAQSGLVMLSNPEVSPNPHLSEAVQLLGEGRVGLVTHVYLGTSSPVADSFRIHRPPDASPAPPPANLDWNLWLGTAPERHYLPGEFHPKKWRAWMNFGTGPAMDDAQDLLQAIWRGLKLSPPQVVAAEPDPAWENSGAREAGLWPAGGHVGWTFPGRGGNRRRGAGCGLV